MPNPSRAADPLQAARRGQSSIEMLTGETMRWLVDLPPQVRPRKLPIEYSRITNRLGHRWNSPRACLDYLEDLLIDRRGNRSGFPVDVALELAVLKNYYETAVHPTQQTAWDHFVGRRFDR